MNGQLSKIYSITVLCACVCVISPISAFSILMHTMISIWNNMSTFINFCITFSDCLACYDDILAAAADCIVSFEWRPCIEDALGGAGASPCIECVCEFIVEISNLLGVDWHCWNKFIKMCNLERYKGLVSDPSKSPPWAPAQKHFTTFLYFYWIQKCFWGYVRLRNFLICDVCQLCLLRQSQSQL